nr:hypothetical protein [Tanacetum cinerariifolium]
MSRDVLTVGSTMRIPLLYRGEYSQWVERFMNYLEEQTDREAMINSIKNEPTPSTRPTKVEVPKELPKVGMVNTSLKKLKPHLASVDVVVKKRTTATAITEGTWGFEHTKACFRDEIVLF